MTLTSNLSNLLTRTEYQEQAKALQAASSLSQMVCTALKIGLLLAQWLLEEELLRRAKEPEKWSNCKACGHRLHSKGWHYRQMQTLVGEIH